MLMHEISVLWVPPFALFDELHMKLDRDQALRAMRDEVLAGGRGE
jgi:hypothetical protein